MKAIVYTQYGPPEVLQLKEVPKPGPRDDEVLIRTYASTVLAGDCELRSFTFPIWFWLPLRIYMGLRRPTRVNILGQELAGEIEFVGKNVRRFRKGDQVFAATEAGFGAYAEYRCLHEDKTLALKPANMTYEEATAVPTGGLNALHYLRAANIQRGEKVLVNGACGNIGTFAVQLAKYFGAEVTGVDSTEKLNMLRTIGADHVIDYTQEDFTRSGPTYDVIFDVIAKTSFSGIISSLKENGRYLMVNPLFFKMVRGLWTSLISSKKVIFAFARYKSEDLMFLKELIEAGKIQSVIDRRYPLEKIAEAHRYAETGHKQGNIVITVRHS
ncbi:MAG: NAD(P)-dependent alcohol dehydrogenase [Nitrospirota bacterium]|nr:MAG: NAD(P)-dependent alcohol dehydrogenase [Nitrospirota bacterium]